MFGLYKWLVKKCYHQSLTLGILLTFTGQENSVQSETGSTQQTTTKQTEQANTTERCQAEYFKQEKRITGMT